MYLPGKAPEVNDCQYTYYDEQNHPDRRTVADPQIQKSFGINAVNQRGSGIVGASLGQDTHRIKNLKGADRTDYQGEEQLGVKSWEG